MSDTQELIGLWEQIAATHPDQGAREEARRELSKLGGEAQPGPYREGIQTGRVPVDPLDAALQRRAAARGNLPETDSPVVGPHSVGPDEEGFQKWYSATSKKLHLDPNPDAKEHYYDHRAFYRAMKNGEVISPDKPGGHFDSRWKLDGHPREFLADDNGKIFDTKTGRYLDGGMVSDEQISKPRDDLPPEALSRLPRPFYKIAAPIDQLDAALQRRAAARVAVPSRPEVAKPPEQEEGLVQRILGLPNRLAGAGLRAVGLGGYMDEMSALNDKLVADPATSKLMEENQQMDKAMRRAGTAAVAGATVAGAVAPFAKRAYDATSTLGRAAGLATRTGIGAGEAATGAAAGSVAGDLASGETEGMGRRAAESGAIGGALGGSAELLRAGVRSAMPWVRKFGEASDAGLMKGAEELPPGRLGSVKASEIARNKILERDKVLMGEAGAKYSAAIDPELSKPANADAIKEELTKIWKANTVPSTGTPINEALDNEIQSLIAKLGPAPTVGDVVALRRSLQQAANFNSASPTDKQLAARELYGAFRTGTREASPAFGAADDAYSAASTQHETRMGIMGNKNGIGDDPQALRAAAAELSNLGEESLPALQRSGDLERLAASDPEIAKALKELEAKKALEATRFSLTPQVRSNLTDIMEKVPVIGSSLGFASQNARAIGKHIDQSVVPGMKAAANAAPFFATPLDAILYRMKLKQKEAQ